MNRIIYINLSEKKVEIKDHQINSLDDCGRALALSILKKNVPPRAEYLDAENAIVLTPGLLSGTHAPSSGRFTVAAKRSQGGLRSVNLAGPFANRLASLGISALVIRGESKDGTPLAVSIDENGASIEPAPDLKHAAVSQTISSMRRKCGEEAAVVGIGPAGEHVMPLGAVFSTYPKGIPEYYCVRGGMGDVFGIKGLKAIAVASKQEFANELADKESFSQKVKEITTLIRNHPICGKALPSYGSITLMKMLKEGASFEEPVAKIETVAAKSETSVNEAQQKHINRACTLNCPIGCLNRHETTGSTPFNSPFDSEAFAASKKFFGIEDQAFVIDLNKRCFEIGLDSIEFLSSCAIILKIEGESDKKAGLTRLLDELESATPLGRIIGSTSRGIHSLYAEYRDTQKLVTQAATSEHAKFSISMPNRVKGAESLSDLEYLYSYILASQNIGLCLFTTFAILDSPDGLEKLAEMVSAKTGAPMDPLSIIQSGHRSLQREREYELESMKAGMLDNIPEFVKVLYRYFGREK